MVPGIYDPTLADEDLRVEHRRRAYRMVRRLAREEGLLAGISSRRRASRRCSTSPQRLDRGVIVTVFPDGAREIPEREVLDRSME